MNIRSQGRLLALAVENPVARQPQPNAAGEYPTTKANPELHGLGLQSARRIARQNHGCLLTELGEGTFRTIVMLNTGFYPT